METFEARLSELQPSQLYISASKLEEVERSAGGGWGVDAEPLPVHRIGPALVLTDGHSRAFAAWRRGETTVPVCRETDPLDWEAYRVCVEWCIEAGVRAVADLAERIVPDDQYEVLWIDRCAALHQRLAGESSSPGS